MEGQDMAKIHQQDILTDRNRLPCHQVEGSSGCDVTGNDEDGANRNSGQSGDSGKSDPQPGFADALLHEVDVDEAQHPDDANRAETDAADGQAERVEAAGGQRQVRVLSQDLRDAVEPE